MREVMVRVRQSGPAIVVGTVVLMVMAASYAAADVTWDLKNAIFGQSDPLLTPFIQFTDSHGINVWQYELSIDRGNPVRGPDKWFWTKFVDPLWQAYRSCVLVAIWLIRWVLEFGWMAPIREAAVTAYIELSGVIGQMGLVAMFLTIAGVVGAFYIVRGRIATGVWEMVLACVIVAGLSTFLANPAGVILNPDHGVAYAARDISLDVAAAVSQEPDRDPDKQVNQITSSLIETFLRQPLQLANFGVVLDDGPCEQVYDEVLKSGPHAWGSEIRDKVNGCNSKVGEYAATPSPSMAISLAFMYVGAGVVFALAIVICGAVLKAGITFGYLTVKSAVTTVIAVLPGAARRPFWGTIADTIIAFAVFVFSFFSLSVYLFAVDVVLGASPDMPAPQRMIVMDVLLIVLLLLFLTNKKRIEQSAAKLREMLATRPGGGVGAGAPPPKLNTAVAVSAAANVAHLARDVMRGRKQRPPALQPVGAAGSQPWLDAGVGGFVGGGFHSPPPPAPTWPRPGPGPGGGGPSSGPGGRYLPGGAGGTARQVAAFGAELALAHMTGGASKALTTGYKVARIVKPKPRPQLPAGSVPNPAVRSTSGGRSLPAGRRPLELMPGPSATPASPPPVRRTSTTEPTAPRTTSGAAAGPQLRKPVRPASTAATSQRRPIAPPRRPVRRPQGQRGR